MPNLTLLTPYAYYKSKCGYCSPPGQRSKGETSLAYGMLGKQMSPDNYEKMIDRGWRRSGTFAYHPDMARTCCPQYTIRLDTAAFKPNRHQRSALNRWNRYLETGLKPGETEPDDPMSAGPQAGKKGKGKGKAAPFDLDAELRAFVGDKGKHTFELEFRPAQATTETFELYRRYQLTVHRDPPHKATRRGFENFLCDSPLGDERIAYSGDSEGLPKTYGSYHVLYRVDGALVGISVIDVLPGCVSSVYFIWDPDWSWAALGKVSALYELGLVRRMAAAGAPGMRWLYMGYWIANCQKMLYKGEYAPSFLLDPGTQAWHSLTPKLASYLASHTGYTPFAEIEGMDDALVSKWKTAVEPPAGSNDATSGVKDDEGMKDDEGEEEEEDDDEIDWPSPPPPGFLDPDSIPASVQNGAMVAMRQRGKLFALPFGQFRELLTPAGRRCVPELLAAMGPDMFAQEGRGEEATKAMLCFD